MTTIAPLAPTAAISPEEAAVRLELCRRSFLNFLPYWSFVNREKSTVHTFAELWPGQAELAALMQQYPWLFALKAGKLGFTELACAYDAYAALFRYGFGAKVGMFAQGLGPARELLSLVKFGIKNLPPWMGVQIAADRAGGDTLGSMKVRLASMHPDDVREISTHAAKGKAAIHTTLQHAHLDEFSHVEGDTAFWNGVITIVAPEGSLHIVTRGNGPDKESANLWKSAKAAMKTTPDLVGRAPFPYPFFAPYDRRPDRNARTRQMLKESGSYSATGLAYFQPETEDDALMGNAQTEFVDMALWDACYDPKMPPFIPGDRTPCVLALDAGITSDQFGAVIVSRNTWTPGRIADPAIRASKRWRAEDFKDGRIDFKEVQRWVRFVIGGGHIGQDERMHPRSWFKENATECDRCAKKDADIPGFNIVQVTYDRHELEDMSQAMRNDGIAWVDEFSQGTDRLVADAMLYKMIVTRRLAHNGDPVLREHIQNAAAEVKGTDKGGEKMRIIKRQPDLKVDLTVCASMATYRALSLVLA